MTKILHVPYTYAPDPMGGTEYYVRSLAEHLQHCGFSSTIAAPGSKNSSGLQGGLEVYRFAGSQSPDAAAEGVPDPNAASAFQQILAKTSPSIVHLHARSAAVSELLLDAARASGACTVVTYHTPTLSCLRGTMLLNGSTQCDGVLDARRCAACVLRRHGVIDPLPAALARLPARLGVSLQALGLEYGPWRALRMRQIVSQHIARTQRFLSLADLVVAPCQWVADLLLANGLSQEKLRLCRQGLAHPLPSNEPSRKSQGPTLALGFFGRIDPTKGIEVLFRALRCIPTAPLELNIYGVSQEGSDSYSLQLQTMAREDKRIRFLPSLSSDQVLATMAGLDLVVVPSLWLETGPLVVLEAFAAGVPVLGSNRGGIAELVQSGINGQLLPTGDHKIWSETLSSLAANPQIVKHWRAAVKSPRTMRTVAEEMAVSYADLLKSSNIQQ